MAIPAAQDKSTDVAVDGFTMLQLDFTHVLHFCTVFLLKATMAAPEEVSVDAASVISEPESISSV